MVTLAIAEGAQESHNVAAYVDAETSLHTAWEAKGSIKRARARSYEQFRIQVASAGLQEWPVWGENAGPVELEFAALDLIRQTEPRKQMQYLRIFWKHPFPPELSIFISKERMKSSAACAKMPSISC